MNEFNWDFVFKEIFPQPRAFKNYRKMEALFLPGLPKALTLLPDSRARRICL